MSRTAFTFPTEGPNNVAVVAPFRPFWCDNIAAKPEPLTPLGSVPIVSMRLEGRAVESISHDARVCLGPDTPLIVTTERPAVVIVVGY